MDEKKASLGVKKPPKSEKKRFPFKKSWTSPISQFCYHSRLLFGTRKVFSLPWGRVKNPTFS